MLLGRSLEERARIKASSDMNELLSLVSTQARLVIAPAESDSFADAVLSSDTICIKVSTDDVQVGDRLLVLPGETIPVDGKVAAGRSVVDESLLTGESLPVFKEKGFSVSAGTINWDGPITVEATSTGSNSAISKIIHMVEEAQIPKLQFSLSASINIINGPSIDLNLIKSLAKHSIPINHCRISLSSCRQLPMSTTPRRCSALPAAPPDHSGPGVSAFPGGRGSGERRGFSGDRTVVG